MRLLLLDDDGTTLAGLKRCLREGGHTFVTAGNTEDAALQAVDRSGGGFDAIVVLDAARPGARGTELVLRLRREGDGTPVLVLTGATSPADRVRALEEGADDVVLEPFDPLELVARISAVHRRHLVLPVIRVGIMTLDLAHRTVYLDSDRVDLSPREFEVLRVLAEARGATVSRAHLLKSVWGMDFDPGTTVLEAQVARLRRKVERGGTPVIETVVGTGYRMAIPVRDRRGATALVDGNDRT